MTDQEWREEIADTLAEMNLLLERIADTLEGGALRGAIRILDTPPGLDSSMPANARRLPLGLSTHTPPVNIDQGVLAGCALGEDEPPSRTRHCWEDPGYEPDPAEENGGTDWCE